MKQDHDGDGGQQQQTTHHCGPRGIPPLPSSPEIHRYQTIPQKETPLLSPQTRRRKSLRHSSASECHRATRLGMRTHLIHLALKCSHQSHKGYTLHMRTTTIIPGLSIMSIYYNFTSNYFISISIEETATQKQQTKMSRRSRTSKSVGSTTGGVSYYECGDTDNP